MTTATEVEFQKTPRGDTVEELIRTACTGDSATRAQMADWLTDSGFPYEKADVIREANWAGTAEGTHVIHDLHAFLTDQAIAHYGTYGSSRSAFSVQAAAGLCIILAIINALVSHDLVLSLILVGIVFLLETLATLSNRRV